MITYLSQSIVFVKLSLCIAVRDRYMLLDIDLLDVYQIGSEMQRSVPDERSAGFSLNWIFHGTFFFYYLIILPVSVRNLHITSIY